MTFIEKWRQRVSIDFCRYIGHAAARLDIEFCLLDVREVVAAELYRNGNEGDAYGEEE